MNLNVRRHKRNGVGERAPFLITFMILFQLSLGAVNTLNMFSYSIPVATSPFSGSTLASIDQCTTYTVGTNAAQCNPSVGNDVSSSPNILVFGDWFRALTMIYQFFVATLIPGWFLMQIGLPAIWAGLFTAGFYVAWLWLAIWMISGRPT